MDAGDEFTPTTEQVRALYATGTPAHRVSVRQGNAEFDRWLAARDAGVAERIAEAIEAHDVGPYNAGTTEAVEGRALRTAARLARDVGGGS